MKKLILSMLFISVGAAFADTQITLKLEHYYADNNKNNGLTNDFEEVAKNNPEIIKGVEKLDEITYRFFITDKTDNNNPVVYVRYKDSKNGTYQYDKVAIFSKGAFENSQSVYKSTGVTVLRSSSQSTNVGVSCHKISDNNYICTGDYNVYN